MALSLSLRKNNKFFVDQDEVKLVKIKSLSSATLLVNGENTFDVFDDRMVEILPDVLVSIGNRSESGVARLAIEAPREKIILRDELRD